MFEEDYSIFKESTYDYSMIRPDDLESINYIEYLKNYEIILKFSKRHIPKK